MFQQRKLLNGVVNYDIFMRRFVFSIDSTREEFYSKLKIHNVDDVLEYEFDEQNSVVTFTVHSRQFAYKIKVDEYEQIAILRAEQVPFVSKVTYHINAFFIKKFNAEPIDYRSYGF